MTTRIAYIHTKSGLSMAIAGRPFHVATDDPAFNEVLDLIRSGDDGTKVIERLERVQARLKRAVALSTKLVYQGGVIMYQGEVLHNYAADMLVGLLESGGEWQPLANFLEKLQKNPSKRVVDSLYAFLEHGKMPITADGDFLAYKAVRKDFKDIYSGKFDNSVGAICEMPRNRVDEDQNRTCSAGLHVCSFDYLPHFSHADGHVMLCAVNPADVVAIPADYNNTKMRVSRYVVVDEVTGYYSQNKDFLGDIGRAGGLADPEFDVFTENYDTQEVNLLGSFFTREEARRQAERALAEDGSIDQAWVENDVGVLDSFHS